MQNKIVIFGVGKQGDMAYSALSSKHDIICFADNNERYAGKKFHEKEIVIGNDIAQYLTNEIDVVVAIAKFEDVCSQLYGHVKGQIYVFIDDIIYKWKNSSSPVNFKRCNRCIMDNMSDIYIIFDDNGNCNYCNSARKHMLEQYFPNNPEKLEDIINKIKKDGENKKYDCVMGVSGGLDSSYLLYLGYLWGLRILAIHIDDGFDSDTAKQNIKKLVERTGCDYEVIKPDSEQYNDLILSFMKASVANIAIPQDSILFAFLYKKMQEYNLEYFLSGENFALESILQRGNTHSYLDSVHILDY